MSNIDKQSLRTAAENATPGEWCTDDYHGVIADAGLNANYYISSCSGPDNRSNKRFIAAANPATVLALLDDLEAAHTARREAQARVAELTEQVQALGRKLHRHKLDTARLDWLADRENDIGNVQLPTECVLAYPESMRAAIDAAMRAGCVR